MKLLKKQIFPDSCPALYDRPFTAASLAEDFEVRGGNWYVEDGYLIGENPGNFPGMVISRNSYRDNILLDVWASTVSPCTHDINLMWNGSWNEETNTRDVAYVAGLQGWWNGKVGFEKSPDYTLNAATSLFPFEPGREYHIQCGSLHGHVFVIVDGVLVLEVTDPNPIDVTKYGRIGFEAYCSKIRFRDLVVRKAIWTDIEEHYIPEFE